MYISAHQQCMTPTAVNSTEPSQRWSVRQGVCQLCVQIQAKVCPQTPHTLVLCSEWFMLWIEWRSTFNLHNPAYTTVQSCSVTNGTEPTGSSEIQVLLHKWSLDSYTPNNKTSCKNVSQHSTQSCSLEIPTPIPTSVPFPFLLIEVILYYT